MNEKLFIICNLYLLFPFQHGSSTVDYQNQAKLILRRLNFQSPSRCTIETSGFYVFQYGLFCIHASVLIVNHSKMWWNDYSYLIEQNICYLVLCDKNYSKKLAFSFLEDIAQEFWSQYGKRVPTVARPYTFIEFGKNQQLYHISIFGTINAKYWFLFHRHLRAES